MRVLAERARHVAELQELAAASLVIDSARSVGEVLQAVTEKGIFLRFRML